MIGIENLEGTNFRDYLNGDAGDNLLRGNGDNDVLFGGGGNDRLEGGFGDDTYVLTDFTDTVIDSSGIDTINSTITRSLAAHATIENLKLIGTDNTNATGNGLDNTLTGNGGNNVLDGVAGEDTLIGGLGDDTFVLADGSDTVTDTGGIDTITTTVSRTIAANIEIENLILLGTGGLTGTGNGLGNRITGNAGANALVGAGGNDTLRGGAARDVLIGGADNDTFAYLGAADSTPGALRDVIQDFNDAGNDTIDVSALIAGVMRFRGTSAFTAANQVRLNDVAGANVVVEVNLDANLATVEMEILLASTDVTTLGAADFIL